MYYDVHESLHAVSIRKIDNDETTVKQIVTDALSNCNQPCLPPVFIFCSPAPSYIIPSLTLRH